MRETSGSRKTLSVGKAAALAVAACTIAASLLWGLDKPTEDPPAGFSRINQRLPLDASAADLASPHRRIEQSTPAKPGQASTPQRASGSMAASESHNMPTLSRPFPRAVDVYRKALSAIDPDERAIAVRYAVACVLSHSATPEHRAFDDAERSRARAVVAEICEGSDEGTFKAQLLAARDHAGSLFSLLIRFHPKSPTQEQEQAQMVVLSNPEKYPWHVAAWSDRAVANNYSILGDDTSAISQRRVAQTILLEMLQLDPEMIRFEQLRACSEANMCPEVVATLDKQHPEARALAAELANAIRRQDWPSLSRLIAGDRTPRP